MLNCFSHPGSIYDYRSGELHGAEAIRALVRNRESQLQKLGINGGSRVLLMKGNGLGFFVDFFALWNLGACAIPLDPKSKGQEQERARALCGADFTLSDQEISHPGPRPVNFREDTALMLLSSGTTGKPKAVMHSRDSIFKRISSLPRLCSAEEIARTLCVLPVHFGHGLITNSLFPFLHGASLFLYPAFDQEICLRLGEIIDRHQITFVSSVPALWNIAAALSAPPAGTSLRRVCCASSALGRPTWEKIRSWCPGGVKITNVYGTTETASWVCGITDRAEYEPGCVGRPWEAQISCGEDGVVAIATGSLMSGYCNDPEATAHALRGGKFFTEDVGRLDADGNLFLLGRLGDAIHKAGMKVHPTEVEETLQDHPAVADVCVFSCPNELSGEIVGAAVVFRSPVPFAELEAWCRNRVSGYKVPDAWFAVQEIPRNARGKVNRKEMSAVCLK